MDNQLQTFMELTALPVLADLAGDRRAAWVWSADGSRILWANAAGAAFFSVREVTGLARLDGLARSPARPHIARIATSGPLDKPSIDRLRFYRGLRVLLLTCQCQRLQLDDGHDAALVICADKGLALPAPALPAFLELVSAAGRTAVLQNENGVVSARHGSLEGTPEFLDLPDGQSVVFGPLEVDGNFHEGAIAQLGQDTRLVLLLNEALPQEAPVAEETLSEDLTEAADDTPPAATQAEEEATPAAMDDADAAEALEQPSAQEADPAAQEHSAESKWAKAEDLAEEEDSSQHNLEPDELSTQVLSAPEPDSHPAKQDSFEPNLHPETVNEAAVVEQQEFVDTGFRFVSRRRPVRFAWKMDIDQRFTFISDEFCETLGPDAANIVGKTWKEIAADFDLDVTGSIGSALDRRDTWSGKTVDWPVTGRALRVPVDMAALPAFDRNRQFEGYRGFGVCRTADAVEDPLAPLLAPAVTVADGSAQEEIEAEAAALSEATDLADESAIEHSPQEAVAALATADPASSALPLIESPEVLPEVQPEDPVSAVSAVAELQTQTDDSGDTGEAAQTDALAGMPETEPVISSGDAVETDQSDDTAEISHVEPVTQSDESEVQATLAPAAEMPEQPLADLPEADLSGNTPDTGLVETEHGNDISEENHPEDGGVRESESAVAPEPESVDLAEEPAAEAPEPDLDRPQDAEDMDTGQAEEAEEAPADPSWNEQPVAEADLQDHKDLKPQPKQPLAGGTLIGASAAALLTGLSLKTSRPAAPAQPATEQDLFPRDEAAPVSGAQASEAEEPSAPTSKPVSGPKDEPSGISGSAPLHPSEIETAVRTLAKNYGRKPQESLPLTPPLKPADELAADASPAQPAGADTDSSSPAEAVSINPAEDSRTGNDNLRHDNDALTQTLPQADAEDLAPEQDAAPEAAIEPAAVPEADTSKVIHLAGRRPQVVPVDTSRLSRPERAAFRKIAEALGARLEGDFEEEQEEEGPDHELEQELARFNQPPQAGPIDPRLLDRLPIGIAIARDRDVLYANDTLLAMLGYKSLAALADAGGLEAVFVEDDGSFPDAEGMEGTVDDTLKVRLAGGGLRAVDARMHSVPWNGGSGLMISITERPVPQTAAPAPVADAALKKAEDQVAELDTILETATDGVLVLDRFGTITKVNRSAEALFSANRVDMVGAPLTEFLAPESHRSAADYLDGLMRNGVASILNDGREVLGRVSSGGLIPLFMTIGRISGNGGEPKFCAVLRDITQWKTAEEELTQAKRQAENASSQKSDFLAKISHEIRTPLNAIIGFSEVMIEERFGAIGNDRYKEYLKDIRTSGSHIMSLVNDLLDLSKIEAGKMDLRFSAVSPNDVMSECVALMQPQANRERVIIRASLPDSVPSVVVDQRSLRQIMLNLLSNAIKFNKSGGQVIISSALEDTGEVVLRVRDTGTGMSPKDLAAALEPFRQVHTSRYGGGTGLGLPLTKALVEANRATFRIDSTPDQGTLVEIRFPSQRVLAE